MQYDLDKETVAVTEVRHAPRPPSPVLLEGVRHLKAGQLEGKFPWEPYLRVASHAFKPSVTRPREATDVLVDSLNPDLELSHPLDHNRRARKPRIFTGPIASANKLLKNPIKRDALRDKFKVKAVEMETSGVADATYMADAGYLAIRGICDYCDSNKNDLWQNWAAVAAAAYTRALLESIPASPNSDQCNWQDGVPAGEAVDNRSIQHNSPCTTERKSSNDTTATSNRRHALEKAGRSPVTLEWETPGFLPTPPDVFLGRDQEGKEVQALLLGGARLVTVVGSGGAGKTALTIHVASGMMREYPDGIYFVPLVGITAASAIEGAITDAIRNTRSREVHSPQTLHDLLRGKRVLLVLDNVEQIVEAAIPVGSLVHSLQGIAILATSRTLMRARDEQVYDLRGLPKQAAAQLFVVRARLSGAKPVPEPTDSDVVEICRRLDYIPLGIELVAAQTRLFNAAELVSRLKSALPLVTDGPHDAPQRQRTLLATIEWTYTLRDSVIDVCSMHRPIPVSCVASQLSTL